MKFSPFLLGILLFVGSTCLKAQVSSQENFSKVPWEFNAQAGVNTNGIEYAYGVAWTRLHYVCLKAEVGVDSDFEIAFDTDSETNSSVMRARYFLRPSLLLRTPTLIRSASGANRFNLFFAPGYMLATKASYSPGAKKVYWHLSGGVEWWCNARFAFYASYNVSDYNLYDSFHYTYEEGDVYPHENTQTAAIGFRCKF